MGRTAEDGRKPTTVRVPQEALETLMFKGIHLDKWHEMENEEASKLLDEGEKSILTELLFQDAYRYFGIPKKIRAEDLEDSAVIELVAAVLRESTSVIVQYEALKYNEWRYFTGDGTAAKRNGEFVPDKRIKEIAKIKECEKMYLLSPRATAYLQGMDATAVIRHCTRVAHNKVDRSYEKLSKSIRFYLAQKKVSEEEVAEHLGMTLSELGEWMRKLYYKRQVAIKDAVKAIRKARKEKKE